MTQRHYYPCPDIDCGPCSEQAEKDSDARREPDPYDWQISQDRFEKALDRQGPQT